MTRKYSSTSVEQLLSAPIGAGDTTLSLANTAAVTALLGGVTLAGGNVDQFTIAIDPDTASEEIIFVRGTSGSTLTGLVRGQAGSAATTHSSGATIKHVLTSNDLDYYTSGVDNSITAAGTATLSNKTIALGSNTVSGTTAQFNTALTDGDFATLAGTETLTNKTISASNNTLTGVVTLTGTQTLTNKTLTSPAINEPNTLIGVVPQTGNFTLALSNSYKLMYVDSSSDVTVTVPPTTSVDFTTGTTIFILRQGTGNVTIAGGSGVTVNATPGLKLRARYSVATLVKTDPFNGNVWTLYGDLSA